MVILDKLRIVGLRSFGPEEEDAAYIQFISPVTLFLGQNGCGKTTIIEALKFACSGDMPPGCRQGSGFVHDPKLVRRPETRGQVKLSIKAGNGDTVTILKTVQVTQKLKRLEFKRLEYVITRRKSDGKGYSATGRCLDINTDFLIEFGVSKSILNNVIFCHQEDSNWPLDEPKNVKERFDEIFDATKYNKCLEHLRKLRKEKQNNRKILKLKMDTAKDIKKEVDKKKKKLRDDERSMENLKEIMLEYIEEMEPKSARIKEIDRLKLEFDTQKNNFIIKQKKLETLQEYRRDIEKNLNVIEDSDEEVKKAIDKFSTEIHLKKKKLLESENEIESKTKQENYLSSRISEMHINIGRLEQEENDHKRQIEHRNEILNKVINSLAIDADFYDESSVKIILDNIKKKLHEKCKSREDFLLASETEELEVQNLIYAEREKKAKLDQDIKSLNKQEFDLKMNIRKIKRNLEEADASSNRLAELDEKINLNENELASLMTKFDPNIMTKEIEDASSERDITEKQIEKVDKEIDRLNVLSNLQTEMDLEQKAVARIESDIRSFKSEHEESLMQLLNTDTPDENLDEAFRIREQQLKEEVTELQMSISTCEKKLVAAESEKKHLDEKMKDAKKLLNDNTRLIEEQCNKKPFEAVLKEARKHLEDTKTEKIVQKDSSEVYKHFLKKLKVPDPCCPLCTRNFRDKPPEFVSEIIKGIEKQLIRNPYGLQSIENQLVDLQKKYDTLLQLETVVNKNKILKFEEIPKLNADILKIGKELHKINVELETLNAKITFPEESLRIASSISNEIALFSKQRTEVLKHSRRIAELEKQISAETSGRTLIEAQRDQKQLKIKAMDCRRKIDSLQKQLNIFNEEKQSLGEIKNELFAERLRIQKNAQETVQLRDKLSELHKEEKQLGVEMKERDSAKKPLEQKIKELDTKMKDLKYNNKVNIENMNDKISQIEKSVSEINILQTSIDKFFKNSIIERLTQLKQDLLKLESEKKSCFDLKIKLHSYIDLTKNFLNNHDNVLKNLQQNLALRERIQEENILKKEVEHLSKDFDAQNMKAIEKEKAEINKQLGSLQSKIYQLKGRKSELKKNITDLQNELNQDSVLNAEKKYLEKICMWKVNEGTIDDLGNFIEALDLAMKNFHKERMVDVNKSIRELWTEIYRGNDCDYIEIKTDETATVKDGRRNYNYRVVMIKNGVELDMRGRCSAGQRVLASLVIRIALAETFSSNCGILALDEPTTNLDRRNIESLSRALAELVEKKRNQKNFQLIIITHDRQFLETLAIEDRVDKYFLVDRNIEGKSVVKEVAF